MSSHALFSFQKKQENPNPQSRFGVKQNPFAPRQALGDITNRDFESFSQIPLSTQSHTRQQPSEYPPPEKIFFAPPPKPYEGYHYEIDEEPWFDTEIELEPQPLYEPIQW
ncbi:hypothetical protein GPJ56_003937 [Histomonas meleagridis]|uniref:uncharacterized protein n=1 Tax=Histomonas meleagridis TaxID=135588 RepID=UPI00355ABF9F|nr:hypothetical protein GPJ56_003937 [Histomonas meleagridis]KAH0797520.1 hypothetical protein GO595_009623 [Histomonas meleagridis]